MDVQEFYEILNKQKIHPQFDMNGNLQNGVKDLIEKFITPTYPNVHFTLSDDKRVSNETFTYSFLGESVLDVITKIENEYPICITITPNEQEGFDLSLEYYKRNFYYGRINTK